MHFPEFCCYCSVYLFEQIYRCNYRLIISLLVSKLSKSTGVHIGFSLTAYVTLYIFFFSTDDNDAGSESDTDPQHKASSSRTEHASLLSLRSEEIPQNESVFSNGQDNEEMAKERTVFRLPDDKHTQGIDMQTGEIKCGLLPMMLQSWSSGHLQTLDFSSAQSQQLLKLGAPFFLHPGQLAAKPEALSTTLMGNQFSCLPGGTDLENRSLSSQSITSSSPFMLQLSQNMLASQVCSYCILNNVFSK